MFPSAKITAFSRILTQFFTGLLNFIAPPLSIRRQFLQLLTQVPATLWQEGAAGLVKRTYAAVARYWQTGSLIIPAPPAAIPAPPAAPPPPAYTYAEWIADHEPNQAQLAEQRQLARQLSQQPLISIITPIYYPPLEVFQLAVASLQQQTYTHWQWCLANGGADAALHAYLDQIASQDQRIRLMHLPENLGISGNSNAALTLAEGDFVGLLDHDDALAPNLLYEVACAINQEPEADIFYFDEDKISLDGQERSEPWFKPAWSPDMMLSVNLLGHGVFRRSLLMAQGGFDSATDGAQDWDMALRCSLQARKIVHLAHMLYHWRKIPGSAAVDAQAKPWAYAAQTEALRKHLAALGCRAAQVQPTPAGASIRFSVHDVKISIIIPTKDRLHFIQPCLSSLLEKTTYADFEIVLVDSGSTESGVLAYYASLAQEPRVRIVRYEGDFNYSRANNLGVQHADGDVFLFLNNDTEVIEPDWLESMAGWALRPEIGVVGAKLLRSDGSIQHAGVIVGLEGHASHIFEGMREGGFGVFGSTEWVRNYMAVTGACLMVRRSVLEQIGDFDEEYILTFSDVEFGLRALAAGYRNVWLPFVRLLHHEGGTRGHHIPSHDVARATHHMWQLVLTGDPYFHTDLSAVQRQPALASPRTETRLERFYHVLNVFDLLPQSPVYAETLPDAPAQEPLEIIKAKISPQTITAIVQQIQTESPIDGTIGQGSPIPAGYKVLSLHPPKIGLTHPLNNRFSK